MSEIVLETTIPALRVAKVDAALPTYVALGFSVSWQHQLAPDTPRLTSVRQGSTELFSPSIRSHRRAPWCIS
jgi:hypothetical protein